MEKEFVPYELAVKLKALGFDEHELCLACWIEKDSREGGGIKLEIWNDEDTYYEVKSSIKAPTFSKAFRWFREKYNMQSSIKFTHSKYSFDIHFERLVNGENPPVMVWHLVDSWLGLNLDLFDTYEEAELACLTKLIEIVETRTK